MEFTRAVGYFADGINEQLQSFHGAAECRGINPAPWKRRAVLDSLSRLIKLFQLCSGEDDAGDIWLSTPNMWVCVWSLCNSTSLTLVSTTWISLFYLKRTNFRKNTSDCWLIECFELTFKELSVTACILSATYANYYYFIWQIRVCVMWTFKCDVYLHPQSSLY